VDSPTGGLVRYLARGEETGGALTLMESVTPWGVGPPLHAHVDADEFVHVLEGHLRLVLDGVVHEVPVGSSVFIPMNVPHAWRSAPTVTTRFLFGFVPASPGMEQFFERAAGLPAGTRGVEAFERFAPGTGMELLGPPPTALGGS
jgi:quercetin dioxygenase-like cupin family protein